MKTLPITSLLSLLSNFVLLYARKPLFICLLAIGFFCCNNLHSQPSYLGKTNFGKEFYFSFPANWEYGATSKYCRLYICSPVKTKVSIYIGSRLLRTISTIPFDVTSYDLSHADAQVFTRNDLSPVPDDSVYVDKAVIVKSEASICVYGLNYTTYTSDGMMILPVQSLGKEYIVASAAEIGTSQRLPGQFMIIAPFDGTEVTIELPKDQSTPNHKGSDGAFKIKMNKGDVFSAMTDAPLEDLTGTLINANKPIAVTTGAMCTYLPTTQYTACDHICEMSLPVSSFGKTYYSVPFATRRKGDLYRVIAGTDSANIFINGILYGNLPKKGGGVGKGWVGYLPAARDLVCLRSDKPIQVVQYNNSSSYDGVVSDPFMMNLIPVEAFTKEILFTVPTGWNNYVNLVIDSASYMAIEVSEAATKTWAKLNTIKDYAVFTQKTNNITYVGKQIAFKPGTYRLKSPKPFGAYLYGHSSFESYGYPLGGNFQDSSRTDKILPKLQKEINICNTVANYKLIDLESGLSTIDIDPDSSYNYQLTTSQIIPGTNDTVSANLTVNDPNKPARAIMYVSDQAGNFRIDTVEYKVISMRVMPNSLDISVNASEPKLDTLTLTNTSTIPQKIKRVYLKNGIEFEIVSPQSAFELGALGSPTSSIKIIVRALGKEVGQHQDMLTAEGECISLSINMSVNVERCLHISSSDIDFGEVERVLIESASVKEAGGFGGLRITAIKPPSGKGIDSVFSFLNGAKSSPFVLEQNEVFMLPIQFKPNRSVEYFDSVIISSSSCSGLETDSVIYLRGTGRNIVSVSSEKSESDLIVITPNPAISSGFVSISIPNNLVNLNKGSYELFLTDVLGKVIKEDRFTLQGASHKLDLEGIPAGIYTLLIIDDRSNQFSKKFVVVK